MSQTSLARLELIFDLEIWIKQGPFGTNEPDDQYRHLHDKPREAYERLFALFFPLNVRRTRFTTLAANQMLSREEQAFMEQKGWKDAAVVEVKSFAFLLTDDPAEQIRTQFWSHKKRPPGARMTLGLFSFVSGGASGVAGMAGLAKARPIKQHEFIHYDEARASMRFYFHPDYIRLRPYNDPFLKGRVQLHLRKGLVLPTNTPDEPLTEPTENPTPGEEAPRWQSL